MNDGDQGLLAQQRVAEQREHDPQAFLNYRRSLELAASSGSILALRRRHEISREEADRIYASFVAGLRKRKLYLIGSLRNPAVPELAKRLRLAHPDFDIFDDWYAAGPEADDWWQRYEKDRGRSYMEALQHGHPARHVYEYDRGHLDESTHALLVLPAGKSGHMEIMYAAYGVGAKTAILLEPDAEPRWDVMYKFIPNVFETEEQVNDWLSS